MHVAECKLFLNGFDKLKNSFQLSSPVPLTATLKGKASLEVRTTRLKEFADQPRERASPVTAPLEKPVGFKSSVNREKVLSILESL